MDWDQLRRLFVFDLQACPRYSSSWTRLTFRISRLLTKPLPWYVDVALIVLVILIILSLPRLWKQTQPWRQRWRKSPWKRAVKAIGLTLLALLTSLLILFSPPGLPTAIRLLTAFVPADTGEPAQSIVVLGRGTKAIDPNANTAAQLWRDQRAPRIFLSGRGDAFFMALRLYQQSVPLAVIGGEPCALTTEENARYTASVLKPRGIRRILLITDPPHMLRSLLTFRSWGFEVLPYASPLADTLSYREKLVTVLREYGGLTSYLLRGRFLERHTDQELERLS